MAEKGKCVADMEKPLLIILRREDDRKRLEFSPDEHANHPKSLQCPNWLWLSDNQIRQPLSEPLGTDWEGSDGEEY